MLVSLINNILSASSIVNNPPVISDKIKEELDEEEELVQQLVGLNNVYLDKSLRLMENIQMKLMN